MEKYKLLGWEIAGSDLSKKTLLCDQCKNLSHSLNVLENTESHKKLCVCNSCRIKMLEESNLNMGI
jgi:hypothetical protein